MGGFLSKEHENNYYICHPHTNEHTSIYKYNPSTRNLSLYGDYIPHDVESPLLRELIPLPPYIYSYIYNDTKLVAYSCQSEESQWICLEESYQAHITYLSKKLTIWWYLDKDKQGRWLVGGHSNTQAPAYYWYCCQTQSLTPFNTLQRDALSDFYFYNRERVLTNTPDGLTLYGYLTQPAKENDKNILICRIHGGQWFRDPIGFDPDVQILAAQGYTVLQVDYRGSYGYGKTFINKGELIDLFASTQDVVTMTQYITDTHPHLKKKIFLGRSYGGLMTFTALEQFPEYFDLGIAFVAPLDLETLLKNLPPYWKIYEPIIHHAWGDLLADAQALKKVSPIYHLSKIIKPLFSYHGKKDNRVTVKQYESLMQHQDKLQNVHTVTADPNAGHPYHNSRAMISSYKKVLAFIEQYI